MTQKCPFITALFRRLLECDDVQNTDVTSDIRGYRTSGPEVLFKTCVAMKFVDDNDDDDKQFDTRDDILYHTEVTNS